MAICQNTATDIPHYDLSFYVGDDSQFIFYWSTKYLDPDTGIETKTPVDLTGYSANMHWREDYIGGVTLTTVTQEARVTAGGDPVVHNGVPVVHLTEEVDVEEQNPPIHTEVGVIDEPLLGKVVFTLTKQELRLLFGDAYAKKTYIYDIQMSDPSGLNRTLLLGNVILTNDITRNP